MQLSAVKREIVVFLKSRFQRGLLDLEMLAEILCCCTQCIAVFSSAALLAWPCLGPILSWCRKGQSTGQGRFDASPISITRDVSSKILGVIIFDLRADFAPCYLVHSVDSSINNFY